MRRRAVFLCVRAKAEGACDPQVKRRGSPERPQLYREICSSDYCSRGGEMTGIGLTRRCRRGARVLQLAVEGSGSARPLPRRPFLPRKGRRRKRCRGSSGEWLRQSGGFLRRLRFARIPPRSKRTRVPADLPRASPAR